METPQDDTPGPPVPEHELPDLPENDLGIPDNPILDSVNNLMLRENHNAQSSEYIIICHDGLFIVSTT